MAIEFRCTQCSKLLQTPDDTAGKHAKCPVCGTIVQIPAAGTVAPEPSSGGMGGGMPPSSPDGGASPFAPASQPIPGPDSLNPYQSPAAYGTMPPLLSPSGEIQHTIIDVGDIFSRTWTIFKQQWGMIWVAILIIGGINFGASMMLNFLQMILEQAARQQREIALAGIVVIVVGRLGLAVLTVWLNIGQAIYMLKIARGEPADLGTIFSGGQKLLTVLLASILYGLIVLGGFLLLIIPAIIFSLMFSQFLYLIVDRGVGVTDSLSLSKEITRGNKMTMFAINLLSLLLFIAACLPCCLGLLVATPYFTLMNPVIYLTMTGQPTADQMQVGSGT
jgi:phage FluMu protein Com